MLVIVMTVIMVMVIDLDRYKSYIMWILLTFVTNFIFENYFILNNLKIFIFESWKFVYIFSCYIC